MSMRTPDAAAQAPEAVLMEVCGTADVPAGSMRPVRLPGVEPLVVYNIDGTFHVTADSCSHAQAFLSDGELEGDRVICPAHWAEFHVPSGRALCFPATQGIATYPVTIKSDAVLADLSSLRSKEAK